MHIGSRITFCHKESFQRLKNDELEVEFLVFMIYAKKSKPTPISRLLRKLKPTPTFKKSREKTETDIDQQNRH